MIDFLESQFPEFRIQIRRPRFDSPHQYMTERELEEISMVDYLRMLQSPVSSQVCRQSEVAISDGVSAKAAFSDPEPSPRSACILVGRSGKHNTASQRRHRQFCIPSVRHQAMDPISSERCSIPVHGETAAAHRFCNQPSRSKKSAAGSISALLEREINHSGCQFRRNAISTSRLGTPRRNPFHKSYGQLLDVTELIRALHV